MIFFPNIFTLECTWNVNSFKIFHTIDECRAHVLFAFIQWLRWWWVTTHSQHTYIHTSLLRPSFFLCESEKKQRSQNFVSLLNALCAREFTSNYSAEMCNKWEFGMKWHKMQSLQSTLPHTLPHSRGFVAPYENVCYKRKKEEYTHYTCFISVFVVSEWWHKLLHI